MRRLVTVVAIVLASLVAVAPWLGAVWLCGQLTQGGWQ